MFIGLKQRQKGSENIGKTVSREIKRLFFITYVHVHFCDLVRKHELVDGLWRGRHSGLEPHLDLLLIELGLGLDLRELDHHVALA